MFGFLEVDKTFKPDTSVAFNTAAIPKSRWLQSVVFNPVLIRFVTSMLPKGYCLLPKAYSKKISRASAISC